MPKFQISEYVHFIPPAKPDENFPSKYKFRLIDTMDSLREYCNQDSKYIAFDLETSGLNPVDDFIVGVALCQSPDEGVYVPIKHHTGGLGDEGLDLIYETLCKRERVLVFNLRFDFRMMEWHKFDESGYLNITNSRSRGYDMSNVKYLDVAVPCFLADTNMGAVYAKNEVSFKKWYQESNKQLKLGSLKHWSLHFLGWQQMKFQDVLGDAQNFFHLDPQEAVFYASTDALATYHIAFKTMDYFKEAKFAGQLDNSLLYPLMRCEQNTIKLDEGQIKLLEEEVVPEIKRIEKELFQVIAKANPALIVPRTTPKKSMDELDFDINFNLKSGPQRIALFTYLGVDTGDYTPKGQMKTGKEQMAKVMEMYPPEHIGHQFAKLYLKYTEITHFESSYIEPIKREAEWHNCRARFSYRTDRAPTTRLAGGGENKKRAKTTKPFFSLMNIQSIIKPKPHIWYTRKVQGEPTTLSNFLGWEFSPEPFPQDRDQWTLEGFSPKLNLRKVLRSDEGYVFVSVDFQAQELRIPTNLSKEPVWTKAFLSGADVHQSTAYQIWGAENYDKVKRKMAKGGAFGLLYGGNEYTMQHNLGLTEQEAKDFVASFRGALPTLFGYFDSVVKKARKEHTVYTYFGHPRRLRYFYKSNNFQMKSFADRTAMNSPIQGTGADILKIALVKLWKELYNVPEWSNDCNFMSTVHDEINSQVKAERLEEFMDKKMSIMELKVPGWEVPMEAGISIGNSWGELFDFKRKDGHWVPKVDNWDEPWTLKEKAKDELVNTITESFSVDSFFEDDEYEEVDDYGW